MGEITNEVQQDWIGIDEQIRTGRLSLKRAAHRIGLAALAHRVNLDETTLRNQVNWQPRADGKGCWRPSADVSLEVFFADRQHRTELLGQCKEKIAPVADLTPEDFMRHVIAKAVGGGFHPSDRDELLDLAQRVGRDGQ